MVYTSNGPVTPASAHRDEVLVLQCDNHPERCIPERLAPNLEPEPYTSQPNLMPPLNPILGVYGDTLLLMPQPETLQHSKP